MSTLQRSSGDLRVSCVSSEQVPCEGRVFARSVGEEREARKLCLCFLLLICSKLVTTPVSYSEKSRVPSTVLHGEVFPPPSKQSQSAEK